MLSQDYINWTYVGVSACVRAYMCMSAHVMWIHACVCACVYMCTYVLCMCVYTCMHVHVLNWPDIPISRKGWDHATPSAYRAKTRALLPCLTRPTPFEYGQHTIHVPYQELIQLQRKRVVKTTIHSLHSRWYIENEQAYPVIICISYGYSMREVVSREL